MKTKQFSYELTRKTRTKTKPACHSDGALVELRDSQYEKRSLQLRTEESSITQEDPSSFLLRITIAIFIFFCATEGHWSLYEKEKSGMTRPLFDVLC